MESSSSSAPDDDSDQDAKVFEPNNSKSIMNADLKNTTDRRLLLGIIHRDNDLEPRKMESANSPNGTGTLEMHQISQTQTSQMNSSILGPADGNEIQDIDALNNPGGTLGNRVQPDDDHERRRDVNLSIGSSKIRRKF